MSLNHLTTSQICDSVILHNPFKDIIIVSPSTLGEDANAALQCVLLVNSTKALSASFFPDCSIARPNCVWLVMTRHILVLLPIDKCYVLL